MSTIQIFRFSIKVKIVIYLTHTFSLVRHSQCRVVITVITALSQFLFQIIKTMKNVIATSYH